MNAVIFLAVSLAATETNVEPDEVLLFYPTFAALNEQGDRWQLPIHGIVYQPAKGSLADQALLLLFRKFAGIDSEQAESKFFQDRAKLFLVDNERKRDVYIRLGDQVHRVGPSLPNGHFQTTLTLTLADAEPLRRTAEAQRWIAFQAVFGPGDKRNITGQMQFVPAEGLSVISDIDDTIKVTNVTDRKAVVQNTFTKAFVPVEGMAEVYHRWAEQGAVFHYVSASPWQLYLPLEEFRAEHKFPAGEWRMKHFRWKDSTLWDLLGSQVEYKTNTIEPILQTFPRRKFVCVGDSGEQDPEIYGALARKYPERIAKILIRDVSAASLSPERLDAAFAKVPADKWQVFKDAAELKGMKLPDK